jgi:uncharacterized membrane protein YkvA (DUF1232 family)
MAALVAIWHALRAGNTPGAPSLGERLAVVPAMVRDTLAGRFDGLGTGRLVGMIVGVAYVLSPVDLVPESALLLLGLTDDVLVTTWVAGTLLAGTERYLAWRGLAPTGAGAESATATAGSPRVVVPTVVVERG